MGIKKNKKGRMFMQPSRSVVQVSVVSPSSEASPFPLRASQLRHKQWCRY